MITIRRDGRTVSRSKNLRGVLRYRVHVLAVHVLETTKGALLRVRWADGAYSVAPFASFTVARMWAANRRAWPAPRITHLHQWHAATRADA